MSTQLGAQATPQLLIHGRMVARRVGGIQNAHSRCASNARDRVLMLGCVLLLGLGLGLGQLVLLLLHLLLQQQQLLLLLHLLLLLQLLWRIPT